MIRINLLNNIDAKGLPQGTADIGTVEAVSAPGGETEKRQGLMKLLLLIIPLVGLNYYQNQILIPKKRRALGQVRNELARLKAENSKQGSLSAEIKRIKKEEERFRTRIKVIGGLSQNRSLLIRSLDAVQTLIPEKAWLTSVKMDKKDVTIKGFSVSDSEISNFIQFLQDSIFFSNVLLVNSSEARLDRGNVKQFEITCVVEEVQ